MSNVQRILNVLLLPVIVLVAFLIVKMMIASKPERQTRTPPPVIPSVRYVETTPSNFTPTLWSYGNVRSYYDANISSQVNGEVLIIDPNFNAGNSVNKGDRLVEIDPANYRAAVAQAEANLATTQQALIEEIIRSELAAQDWIESGRKIEDATDLTLRKPQLGAAQAAVDSAQASLDKAQIDLKNTQIRAPFDAIVQSRDTSPGNYVNTGTSLGSLISKERAQVRLPLTPQQLQRIDLPQSHSETELSAILSSPTQPNTEWVAKITRTEPSVDQQNQVIYVIGEIEEPFKNEQAFLPVGAFVDARIAGKPIRGAHLIPQTALVEDQFVWVVRDDNTLSKTAVTRVVAEEQSFVIRFNEMNERSFKVATRPLASFVEGQPVKPISGQ